MSRIHLNRFEYYEPDNVSEAAGLLATYGGRAHILAGGIDLLPRIRSGGVSADCIVNIGRVEGLKRIDFQNDGLYFGAMATLYELEEESALKAGYPILYEAIHQITSVQTKCMGTAIGNICIATPASDVATVMMAYDAELTVFGTGGERRIKLEDFYSGYRKTVLANGEFVTGAFVPVPAPEAGAAFMNRVRTHADIAKISVATTIAIEAGVCKAASIALGAVAPTVIRAKAAESLLAGKTVTEELLQGAAEKAASEGEPITDFRSTAAYRSDMIEVLVRRALEKSAERAVQEVGA